MAGWLGGWVADGWVGGPADFGLARFLDVVRVGFWLLAELGWDSF